MRVAFAFTGPLDHKIPMWAADDISFEIVDDMTDDPVLTLTVSTPAGQLTFMGEPVIEGRVMMARAVHVQGGTPNSVGVGSLLVLARVLMERMELDEFIVEGALRTTGANPGRRPRALRFSRRVCSSPAAEPRDS